MTKGTPADPGNDEFECILLQSGLCVLGFFCPLPASSSDGICPAVKWQNGFYSWCEQGWTQAAAHLKGFRRKSTSNCHKQLPSMIFALTASALSNSPHLKVAVTSTPALIFRNSSILPHFIPGFPCSSFRPPQTFRALLLLSLCFACHLPSAGKHGGYPMLLVLDRENFQGCQSLSVPFPGKYVWVEVTNDMKSSQSYFRQTMWEENSPLVVWVAVSCLLSLGFISPL